MSAFSKAILYPDEDQEFCLYMRALGHPARKSIVRQLSMEGPCTVEQINRNHPISQPALSRHLKPLREAQLIEYNEEYPYTYYYINCENLKRARALVEQFFLELESVDV